MFALAVLGGLAAIALMVDEKYSRHETSRWERDYGRGFTQDSPLRNQ